MTRYHLLGLADPRVDWSTAVLRWAASGVIPAEYTRCVGAEELLSRLAGSRRHSAVLLDGRHPALDRDLLAAITDAGAAALVVDDSGRDWVTLGAAAVLPTDLDPPLLLEVLGDHARPVGLPTRVDVELPGERAPTVVVTGPGGTGASTVAIALAQGLVGVPPPWGVATGRPHAPPAPPDAAAESSGGERPTARSPVVLADLCRRAEQAVLHDATELVPGLEELVDAHRTGAPPVAAVVATTFAVPARGYRLLLGLRHPRHWTLLRPQAVAAALDGLRRAASFLVCDSDPDLEGAAEGGSVDVEERNLLARTAVAVADLVVTVGRGGLKGTYSHVRLIADLVAADVPAERILPVITAVGTRERRAARTALRELTDDLGPLQHPLLLPRRHVDAALHDGAPLPTALVRPLVAAVRRRLETVGPRGGTATVAPEPVRPGSLGVDGGAA